MQRIHKNKSDYGITDYYKFYTNFYNSSVSAKKFNDIITDFNKELTQLIIEDNLFYQLPYLAFELSVRKDKRKPRIQNGNLINNIPVDWKRTNLLWKNDNEAKEKKLLVRYNNSHTSGYVFRIYLSKSKGIIKNKILYKFRPNRIFKRNLSKRINDPNKENYDAYLLYIKNK